MLEDRLVRKIGLLLMMSVCFTRYETSFAQESDTARFPEGEYNAIWELKGIFGYSPVGTTRIWCKQQGDAFVYLEEQSAEIFKGKPRLLVVSIGDAGYEVLVGISEVRDTLPIWDSKIGTFVSPNGVQIDKWKATDRDGQPESLKAYDRDGKEVVSVPVNAAKNKDISKFRVRKEGDETVLEWTDVDTYPGRRGKPIHVRILRTADGATTVARVDRGPSKNDLNQRIEVVERNFSGDVLAIAKKRIAGEQVTLEETKLIMAGILPSVHESRTSTGLIPLTDFDTNVRYKGRTGGLYGGGKNEPPDEHLAAALRAAEQIQPLDSEGRPSPDGRIVLISNGMSNTSQDFTAFIELIKEMSSVSQNVVSINCAQGGVDAVAWATDNSPVPLSAWDQQADRLKQAGVTNQQVQVVWMKHALIIPEAVGEFPANVKAMQRHLQAIVQRLKETFPNLRIAYLSSRYYGGYSESRLSPEPFAYESAFAVRGLIRQQIDGSPELNYDPTIGDVKAPVLLWGPYLWADGVEGRKDGLTWQESDFTNDRIHPSATGERKVAEQLLQFFQTDVTSRPWFLRGQQP